MNIVIFDLETKLSPGVDCKWEEKDKMGISVGAAYAYATGDTSVFLDDNISELWAMLVGADLVSGFNIKEFDIPLIYETMRQHPSVQGQQAVLDKLATDRDAILAKAYDIYHESKLGAGHTVNARVSGFKLDDHLRTIYGEALVKTGDGALAPKLYKDGKIGELASYCMADVHRERVMFEHCWYIRTMKTVGHPQKYDVTPPQKLLGVPVNVRLPWMVFPTTDRGLDTIRAEYSPAKAVDVYRKESEIAVSVNIPIVAHTEEL